jgi:hypothetical protein
MIRKHTTQLLTPSTHSTRHCRPLASGALASVQSAFVCRLQKQSWAGAVAASSAQFRCPLTFSTERPGDRRKHRRSSPSPPRTYTAIRGHTRSCNRALTTVNKRAHQDKSHVGAVGSYKMNNQHIARRTTLVQHHGAELTTPPPPTHTQATHIDSSR